MSSHPRHASAVRVVGNLALVVGLLVSVITLSSDSGSTEPHILAGFLVATGIGLRVEAALRGFRA
ncbi:hypothetical protein ABT008_29575 [Micromonospora sp. NPDC002389]|uniref:hypothetical protein n=1 Tax=Micromonospora sp. NPDC002389 TaxID=3154272 RepID=UPI003320AF65